MKSADNGGILKGRLQVLHVHVLLVAPLGTSHMAQPGTDQHQSGVAVREAAHHTGAAADLPVQSLNDIIGSDTGPVFTWELLYINQGLEALRLALSPTIIIEDRYLQRFFHRLGPAKK